MCLGHISIKLNSFSKLFWKIGNLKKEWWNLQTHTINFYFIEGKEDRKGKKNAIAKLLLFSRGNIRGKDKWVILLYSVLRHLAQLGRVRMVIKCHWVEYEYKFAETYFYRVRYEYEDLIPVLIVELVPLYIVGTCSKISCIHPIKNYNIVLVNKISDRTPFFFNLKSSLFVGTSIVCTWISKLYRSTTYLWRLINIEVSLKFVILEFITCSITFFDIHKQVL